MLLLCYECILRFDARPGSRRFFLIRPGIHTMSVEVHGKGKEANCIGILRSDGYEPEAVDRRKFLAENAC